MICRIDRHFILSLLISSRSQDPRVPGEQPFPYLLCLSHSFIIAFPLFASVPPPFPFFPHKTPSLSRPCEKSARRQSPVHILAPVMSKCLCVRANPFSNPPSRLVPIRRRAPDPRPPVTRPPRPHAQLPGGAEGTRRLRVGVYV